MSGGGTPPDNRKTFVRPPTRSRKRMRQASRNPPKEKEDLGQSDRPASSDEPPEDAEPDEEVHTSVPQTRRCSCGYCPSPSSGAPNREVCSP